MLYMGRLNRIKGIDLLVRAFIDNSSEFENFILVIAGPDEGLQAELLDQINERNLGAKVFFSDFWESRINTMLTKQLSFW